MSGGKRAVYTALLGRYEALAEQPVAVASAVPFICFTDDPELRSDTWDVRLVVPAFELDPVRSARTLKITGHPDLAPYDETLWIDARVRLTADPAVILDDWLADDDVTTVRHSYRPDVVTEFQEVLLAGLDESARLYEQLTHYSTLAPDLLEAPVPWTALLARRRTSEVDLAMTEWLLHVVRYSKRDQLSFVHTLARVGLEPRLVDLDNYVSDLHRWLGLESRSSRQNLFRVSESLQPPLARIGELRLQLEQATALMVETVAAREETIAELEERMKGLEAQVSRRQAKVRELRARLNAKRDG
jgi:hypothetical protein